MAAGVNCLVLDEPTNHLDLDAIEQLETALEAFAGTLLVFIPATGDFINAHFLGDPKSQRVIGTAVQSQFLNQNNYPSAAGISFVLMAIITTLVLIYTKFMGTEDLA